MNGTVPGALSIGPDRRYRRFFAPAGPESNLGARRTNRHPTTNPTNGTHGGC